MPWIGPLIVLAIELPSIWTVPHVGEWFYFWYAGHLVATGMSPFEPANWLPTTHGYGPLAGGLAVNTLDGLDLAQLRTYSRWLWPPIAALLLAPFGALPFELGVPALHVATIVIAIGSALWLVRVLMPPALRPLAFAVLVASPPLVQVMRAATVTLAILPSTALLFAGLGRIDGPRIGLASFGLSIRPQLFLVVLAGLFGVMSARPMRRALVTSAVVWIVLNTVAFVVSPIPLDPSLLDAAREYALHDNSSTWRLAWEVAGDGVAILAPLMLAGALVASAVAVRRSSAASRTEMVIACALALAVAAAPYAHTYDHLALFPAWLLVLRAANARSRGLRTVGSLAVILAALGYGWSAYLVGAAGFRAAVAVTPFLAIALCASVAQRPELQPGTTHPRY